jgi:hypothetical protein
VSEAEEKNKALVRKFFDLLICSYSPAFGEGTRSRKFTKRTFEEIVHLGDASAKVLAHTIYGHT